MVLDELLVLRDGGTTPEVTATEAGSILLARDSVTGKAVIQINKMPLEGLPIIVVAAADTGTSLDRVQVVTIEGSDTLDSGYIVINTFPSITFADKTVKKFIRRVATQFKYIRSVITLTNANGTMSRIYQIYVGTGEVDNC